MSQRILASASPGELRIARLSGDRLLDYVVEHPGRPDGIGDLHLAVVTALRPALGGAFLDLDGEPGFLPDSERGERVVEGQRLGVRVVRAAQGAKGPRVSGCLSEAERRAIAAASGRGLVARGPSPLVALALAHPEVPVVCDDAALTARLEADLGGRVRSVARAFEPELEEQLAALASPHLSLPGGMLATITPTPALVAVDLDSAAASGAAAPKATAQLALNRAALPALLHQLRLRDLSGAILVDPAGLAARKRPLLREVIETALAHDPQRPRLVGFTGLGLIEIVRPRIRPPLHERLASPEAAAAAALRTALAGLPPAAPGRVSISGGLEVIETLTRDQAALAAFALRAPSGLKPLLRLEPDRAPLAWTIEHGTIEHG